MYLNLSLAANPKDSPTSSKCSSQRRTPSRVLRNIGKNEANTITTSLEISPIPNQSINMGTVANGGTWRTNSIISSK